MTAHASRSGQFLAHLECGHYISNPELTSENDREESLSSGPPSEMEVSEKQYIVNSKAKAKNNESDSSTGKGFKAVVQQFNQNTSRSDGKSNSEKTKNIKKKDNVDRSETNV